MQIKERGDGRIDPRLMTSMAFIDGGGGEAMVQVVCMVMLMAATMVETAAIVQWSAQAQPILIAETGSPR